MSLYTLPIGDTTDSSYRIELDNITYTFRFRWNTYDESWQCYLGLAGQDPSIKLKVTNGFDLLEQFRYLDGVPNVLMYCSDWITTSARPTKDEIGTDAGDQFGVVVLTRST